MKRLLTLIILAAFVAASSVAQDTTKSRPTVGIALGGGGAKGAAHIGVLRYLEEIGIPIDYVTGTSIGSIIGGFYSLGYSPDELQALISGMDWSWYMSNVTERQYLSLGGRRAQDTYLMSIPFNTGSLKQNIGDNFLSSLPSGFISGNRITNLFNSLSVGYIDSIDFRNLPIPFACVTTDIRSGDSVVFRSGHLPQAIRSSMAIPGVFSPVHYDSMVLCDGGLIDNLPVELCRNMGADIVIGIDVSDPLVTDNQQLRSLPQLLMQYTGIAMKTDVVKLKPLCDLYMHPDISGYSTLSFYSEAIDSLIERGYRIAKQHHDELMAIKQQVDPNGQYQKHLNAPKAKNFGSDTITISNIYYHGIPKDKERWLRIKDGIYEEQHITRMQIEACISQMEGSGFYTDITYFITITDTSQRYPRADIHIHLKEAQPHNFSLGLRIDSEESAAVLLHFGFNQFKPDGGHLILDGRINHNPRIAATAGYSSKGGFGADLSYSYHNSHFNLGQNFSRNYSLQTVGHSNIAITFNSSKNINSLWSYGLEEDVVTIDSNINLSEHFYNDLDEIFTSPGHTGLFVKYSHDSFNDGYFPTKGGSTTFEGHWRISNDGVNGVINSENRYLGFGDIQLHFQKVLPLGNRVCLIPMMFNRILIGSHKTLYDNLVGGVQRGQFMDQQMPFIGLSMPQQVGDLAHILRADLRINLVGSHYLTLMGNYMAAANDINSYFQNNSAFHQVAGFGIRYSYRLPTGGPISLDINYNTLTERVGLYFNFGCMF